MRIFPITTFKYSSQNPNNKNTSFSSLKLMNDENDYSDTYFYRDIKTLLSTSQILKKTFPNGTTIMDFAASNGEEGISLYSLLNDNNNSKFKIYCYDKSDKAVELGEKGVYSIFSPYSSDYFLLPGAIPKDTSNNKFFALLNNIKHNFDRIMTPVPKPNYQINDIEYINKLKLNPDFQIKYYKIKNEHKDKIKIQKGDINNIEDLLPNKKVGAILFRNALYIETGNVGVNEFWFNEDLSINKQKIIENLVDKIYDKLLPGGLFIVGNIEKDHIYIADENTECNNQIFIREFGTNIYKTSPLWQELSKDNRFEPIVFKKVDSPAVLDKNTLVPTVWRKK